MKRFLPRALAFCLVFVFLLGIFTVFSGISALSATPAASAKASGTQYIFKSLSSDGITYDTDSGTVSLPLYGNPTFRASRVSPVMIPGGTNSLYVTLINRSPSVELTVTYEYTLNSPQTKTVKKAITANTDTVQTVILPVPEIDSATGISVSFGTAEGTVELCSFFNISSYVNSFHDEIAVEICRYNPETGAVEISGTIGWETTVRYSEATLALFALEPAEDAYLSNKTPIARTGISFSFSFSVTGDSTDRLFCRYVIAAVTATGERIPLTSPLYPTVHGETQEDTNAFKGVHTGNFETAISIGAQSAIVDVYLDKVLNTQNSGILYAGEHSYYYFNTDYVSGLDAAVRNLAGAGCRTYLRFLISPDANNLSFVSYTESGEKVVSKGISIKSQDALLAVYALTDFLTARYADDTVGRISGLILGQKVNQASRYNRTDAKTMAEDTALYAAAFALIGGVASRNLPGLSLVLPLSDSRVGDTLEVAEMTGNFPADLYLYSFLVALNDSFLTPPAFTLMVETEMVPAVAAGKNPEAGSDSLGELRTVLHGFSAVYGNLSEQAIVSWSPAQGADADTTEAAYVILFLRLKAAGFVSQFFLNTAGLSAAEAANATETLSYIVRQIDTDRHESAVSPVFERLGKTAAELISGYTAGNYVRRTVRNYPLTSGYGEGVVPIGSYSLWNFTATTGTQDFYSGNSCGDLAVLSGNGLTAKLTFEGTSFSGFACRFAYGQYFSFAPYLKFDFGINGEKGKSYEVQIQLIGNTSLVNAATVLSAGESGTYCLDLSDAADALGDVQCMRICVRPLDGSDGEGTLYLRSVTLQSTQLDDEDLKNKIAKAGNTENGDNDTERRDFTTPVIVTAAVVLVSVAFAVILFTRRKNHNNHSKETEER